MYTPPGQGPPKLISNLTAPSLEVPRKLSQASTMMKSTEVPIAQRSSQTKQKVSQSKLEEKKGRSVQESYSNSRNSSTGTVEGKSISHEDHREALISRSRKTNTDLDKKYEEHQPQIEQNLEIMESKDEKRQDSITELGCQQSPSVHGREA